MSKILGFDHVSIIVSDAQASVAFYQSLLGLKKMDRPDLGFPGYWLDLFSGQSLHIMQVANPNDNTVRPEHGGRDYHFALRVASVSDYVAKMKVEKIPFTLSKSGRQAVFVKDLDNNAFELFEYASTN